jgi:predicted ATPase
MTPEQQRIAIAEACGWKEEEFGPSWYQSYTKMPDYLNDLNAMHEAEKTLDDDLDLDYSENLEIVTGARWGANNSYDMSKYRSATAAQRAEAFLRTIGKWEVSND